MENKQTSSRMVNYDLLRLIAAFLIVMLHLSVQYINKAPASVDEYLQWQQAVKLSTISRVGVPIFVMLSGAFLLNPKKIITLPRLFKKYLPKLILIFFFWSFFYSLAEQDFFKDLFVLGLSDSWSNVNWDKFWPYFAQGHYHMWYLYMLGGLYLITPLIKYVTAQATQAQLIYFVLLCVLVTSVTKLNEELWHFKLLSLIFDKLSLSFFFGYLGYFVAGYVLHTFTPRLRVSAVMLIIGILSFKYTYETTWTLNPMFGFERPNLVFFSNYSPTVFFMSFAVFLLFAKLGELEIFQKKQSVQQPLPSDTLLVTVTNQVAKIVTHLSKYLLVVYLVHPYIIGVCRESGILQAPVSSWSLPINAFIVYLISLAVSFVLMQLLGLCKLVFKPHK